MGETGMEMCHGTLKTLSAAALSFTICFFWESLMVGYKYVIPVSQVTKIIIRMNA